MQQIRTKARAKLKQIKKHEIKRQGPNPNPNPKQARGRAFADNELARQHNTTQDIRECDAQDNAIPQDNRKQHNASQNARQQLRDNISKYQQIPQLIPHQHTNTTPKQEREQERENHQKPKRE